MHVFLIVFVIALVLIIPGVLMQMYFYRHLHSQTEITELPVRRQAPTQQADLHDVLFEAA